jgi:hypothetical protein
MTQDIDSPSGWIENTIQQLSFADEICESHEIENRLNICKKCVNFSYENNVTVCKLTGCNINLMTTAKFKICPIKEWS